ncbi:hypothetical protein F5I97DRAFT_1984083 [Phlebopus sp. FC_14]|nr:hypothetical protein F5I97DRAFT_1984083 [Phlebopus sp. FC_14]
MSDLPHIDKGSLQYIITHVFCPLRLPDGDDHCVASDVAVAEAVCGSARAYAKHVSVANQLQWNSLSKMLYDLGATVCLPTLANDGIVSQISSMAPGHIVSLFIRAQNAAVIIRKREEETVFETFEVSPKARDVMSAQGKLVCSYPGPTITVPNDVVTDEVFLCELANFLVHMNDDVLDAVATTQKAGSTVIEERDTTHPRYIAELLTGILRAVGRPADVQRITKRIGDDVVWNDSRLPWRRSSLWLLIRVALQTTLEQSTLGRERYKAFMLFFMHQLTQKALEKDMSSELLHFMSAKLSRRLKKLGAVRAGMAITGDSADHQESASPHWAPLELSLSEDTKLSLVKSREYLHAALENQTTSSSSSEFNPQHHRRGTLDEFLSVDGKFFEGVYRAEPYLTLYDFERAVAHGIDVWVAGITEEGADRACEKLELSANKYSSNARKMYENNPEDLSLMLLTLLELWVALDKIVVKKIPILKDYSPEVPTTLLERLLLRKRKDLERLRLLYEYIRNRHSCAYRGWSVFSDVVDGDNFRIQYYNNSPHLQSIRSHIESAARSKRAQKVQELQKCNARHAGLKQEAAHIDHVYSVDRLGNRKHAKKKCPKCDLERQLGSMKIGVHEWPLPAESLRASIVVFELDCPVAFNMWRSSTMHLLVDVCSPSQKRTQPYVLLHNFSALLPYGKRHSRSRVSLASDTKPFTAAHYKTTGIPGRESQVCVNNGLQFYTFDKDAHIPATNSFAAVDVSRLCTYQPQSGAYQNLQVYLQETSHTSNEILANQSKCHKDLSIHEFIAFGHMRSGASLQWLNILREFSDTALSFRRDEVYMLLAQTAGHVGPLSPSGVWTWHEELLDPAFCHTLLDELERLAAEVATNWLESTTMMTVSLVAARLLASTQDEVVWLRGQELLRNVRRETFCWVQELSIKLASTADIAELEEVRRRLCEVAAICRNTFDDVAVDSASEIRTFLSCAIFIHQNAPAKTSSISVASRLLLERDRRLSHALTSWLSDAEHISEGIDLAIQEHWPSYRPGSQWKRSGRWFTCLTAPIGSGRPQHVNFNLFDGTLLVDGKSLGRLPSVITQHPFYGSIFGKQVLDVIPADIPGMEFGTRGLIFGYQVYFARKGVQLLIRAKCEEAPDLLQLIPPEKLESDLPAPLVRGHAHWLKLSTRTIQVRPLDKLWEHSSESWAINFAQGHYSMRKGSSTLIDIRSSSWAMISRRLEPLERPENLIITLDCDDANLGAPTLSAELPRYGLSFFVDKDGELQSRNIRDMVYDPDQSTGTMIGLVNQLVLRPKSQLAEEHSPRCVLIPDGDVSFTRNGDHVRVVIDTGRSPLGRVTYQTYKLDAEQCCLVGNVSLTNKLYQAYLHALTSNPCSTDPLTGRTGTEEALYILRSAGCQSFMKITPRDAELLCLIGSLVPDRVWYPKHLKHMQSVRWLGLPTAAQHHGLYNAAKSIKETFERLQVFQTVQTTSLFEKFPSPDAHLLARAARRAAYLYPVEFSDSLPNEACDATYQARDRVTPDAGEHRACGAALTVYRWSSKLDTIPDILHVVQSWKGTLESHASISLSYSREWLRPNLPAMWITAYNMLRRGGEQMRFSALFSFAAMAYGSPHLEKLVPTLIAFATVPDFRMEDPPHYSVYDLSLGFSPLSSLCQQITLCASRFEDSPEGAIALSHGGGKKASRDCRKAYNQRVTEDADIAADELMASWPCELPPTCLALAPSLYDLERLTISLRPVFSGCYHNVKLREHLDRVQWILNQVRDSRGRMEKYAFSFCSRSYPRVAWRVTLDELLKRPPPVQASNPHSLPPLASIVEKSLHHSPRIHQLIMALSARSDNRFQRTYAEDLRRSADHLGMEKLFVLAEAMKETTEFLKQHYFLCRKAYLTSLVAIMRALCPQTMLEHSICNSGQWPRTAPQDLFRCLASTTPVALTAGWQDCIMSLVMLVLELQRARRLLLLAVSGHLEDFFKELENRGCESCERQSYPDWLLIQLEGNFLIRPVQASVAFEMISPGSCKNTALQLHMGEGKSSVIVPIAVAALANGEQLVRVVIPKTLAAQMFQLLTSRLSGLTNRKIYYLPFSRSVKIGPSEVHALLETLQQCKRERGILVVQPDHILSCMLMSVEKHLRRDSLLAQKLLHLQAWIHSNARDILDESDEILHVRYQLVYTIGLQKHLEGFPDRWTTVQQLLYVVRKHAYSLCEEFPLGLELEDGLCGSFPHTRILQPGPGEELISRVVQDVMEGLLPNFGFDQARSEVRAAIHNFIACKNVTPSDIRLVEDYGRGSQVWKGLLHLRGLLALGILLYSLKERRWRVDYGLSPPRTMLAVPYRAKDMPAPRAEFGHPDIAITLTCLSYYYGGLTEDQLRTCLEMLLKLDNPDLEYEQWVQHCPAISETFRNVNTINVQSSEQWKTNLFPLFYRNKAVVDFYLARVVFPKAAKEFPSKLSCSGWDLAETRTRLVTGFSGTNDGRYLLPTSITQRDPDHQRGTNAKVLAYLLQPENDSYIQTAWANGERRTALQFLQLVVAQKPKIRVLLDVGAQMLELKNRELAMSWLNLRQDVQAAIYFDDDDELTVLTRDGTTQLLLSSPFAQQLDKCVAYLDDAHTRGTDIRFPSGFKAAVTLGPKVTKDRLTQGCMRMRKLGTKHSVMFFAPLEVDRSIRSVASKSSSDPIGSMDILQWAIHETCNDIQKRAPDWAQQGMDHASRYHAWSNFCQNKISSEGLAKAWLQPEAKSLEDLYTPGKSRRQPPLELPEIRQRCTDLDILSLANAELDEEQEREVIHEMEMERERQVQRPPKVQAATHAVDKDVQTFVQSGVVPHGSTAFRHIFNSLVNTSAAFRESEVWTQRVLATRDFCKTVVATLGKADDYLRPVNWIISSFAGPDPVLVVISPYEANQLLPAIRTSSRVHLHTYVARTSKWMKPCEDLKLYTIPPLPVNWSPPPTLTSDMDQLALFAGQLYLRDHTAYIRLCRHLCIYAKDLEDEGDFDIESDGFIRPEHRPRTARADKSFSETPLPAVKALISLRRKGLNFAPSHMGRVLSGRLLTEEDFAG